MPEDKKSTVVGLFENWIDAKDALRELENIGYDETAIGLLSGAEAIQKLDSEGIETEGSETEKEDSFIPAGVVGGIAVGELVGLITGGMLVAIPGFGLALAAGVILSASISGGAIVGAIAGALVGMGVEDERAQALVDAIKSGYTLLTVNTNQAATTSVSELMQQANATSVEVVS